MDTELEKRSIPTTQEVPPTKRRILLFFVTYMVGVIITTAIIALRIALDQSSLPSGLLERTLRVFSATTFVLPVGFVLAVEWLLQDVFGWNVILVSGLHIPSPESAMDTPLQAVTQGLAYLLFISISIVGIATTNRQTFRVLYFVFIGLLIIAIGGCMRLQ